MWMKFESSQDRAVLINLSQAKKIWPALDEKTGKPVPGLISIDGLHVKGDMGMLALAIGAGYFN